MRLGRALPPAFYNIARLRRDGCAADAEEPPAPDISITAEMRRIKVGWWRACVSAGIPVAEAAARVGVSKSTLYRWEAALAKDGPAGLEPESRRPHNVRERVWGEPELQAVQTLRESTPGWGKEKLAPLLQGQGWNMSPSTVGRVLGALKTAGRIADDPARSLAPRKRRPPRPHAVRKPREWPAQQPGDIVQLDTKYLEPICDRKWFHYTARDMVSRWDVLQVYPASNADNSAAFLDELIDRMPFPVRSIQVDGGSEFMGAFEHACQDRSIPLWVLPPASPKLNGRVERAQRTHEEEFYNYYAGPVDIPAMRRDLGRWETVYNTIRPHRSLDNLSPQAYLAQHHPHLLTSPDSHMS